MNLLDFLNASDARGEQRQEQQRQEGMEAQTLRKLMSLYQPERKDEFATMNLADLRGHTQQFALKKTLADIGLDRARSDELAGQVETMKRKRQSATALRNLLQTASTDTGTFEAPGSSLLGPIRSPVTVPLTMSRLRAALPANADAVNAEDFPQRVNALQQIIGESGGLTPGLVQPISGYPNHGFVALSKGSGTVIANDAARTGTIYNDPEQQPKSTPPKGFQWIWDGDKWKMAAEHAENPLGALLGGNGPSPAQTAPSQSADYEWKDGKLIKLTK